MGGCYGGVNTLVKLIADTGSEFLPGGERVEPQGRITGKKNPRRSEEFFRWCPGEDSNLHGFTR